MAIGRVKWFNNEKGYGFIEADVSNQDIFVHFSDIQMDGYKTLQADMPVSFELSQGTRGPSARAVRPLTDAVTVAEGAFTTWQQPEGMPASRGEERHFFRPQARQPYGDMAASGH